MLEKIYEAVGCLDVPRKPSMSYKLANASQKSTAIAFATEDDYDGLLEDVDASETKLNKSWKNGDRWQSMPVHILIPDDVSPLPLSPVW